MIDQQRSDYTYKLFKIYIPIKSGSCMVEKMTAVWLIILTIIVCSAVPALMIWLTTSPHPKFLLRLSPISYNLSPFAGFE